MTITSNMPPMPPRAPAGSQTSDRYGNVFKRLGVALVDGKVVTDDAAPLAHVRKAMTAR